MKRINGYVILAIEPINGTSDRVLLGYHEHDAQFAVATLYKEQGDDPNEWFRGDYFLPNFPGDGKAASDAVKRFYERKDGS